MIVVEIALIEEFTLLGVVLDFQVPVDSDRFLELWVRVVEQVFGWPGLGTAFITAATRQEINLILAVTLFTGTAIVIANLLADIMYAVLDPRIRDEY